MSEFTEHIPGLGEVKLRTLYGSDVQALHEFVATVDESERAEAFSNFVFRTVIVDTALHERIPKLEGETLAALEKIAADQLMWLRRPYEEFVAALSELTPRERLYTVYREKERELEESYQRMLQRMEEFEAAAPAISNALKEAGFWISPSVPLQTVWKLEALVNDQAATPTQVREVIVDRFRKDECKHLRRIVESWYDLPYFSERRAILEDATAAHIGKKFTLSIPALLPLAEGFWRSQKGLPKYKGLGRWIAQGLKPGSQEEASGMDELDTGALIPFVERGIYLDIPRTEQTPEKYTEWIQERGWGKSRLLLRHAILHGLQADYASEENSLRAFLFLDTLYHTAKAQFGE